MHVMEQVDKCYYLEPKYERVFGYLSLAVFFLFAFAVILHKLIGFDGIIESIYNGRSFDFLNDLIKFQQTKSVDYYISLANTLFYRAVFKSLLVLAFVNLTVRSIVFRKAPHPAWLFMFGCAVILGINFLNPNNRIYSSHGFMHAGIVYEILNGRVPPNDPLLAEVPLCFPWGHHFLAAVFVKTLNISPLWAFCVINILAMLGCTFTIYKISRLLINCPRANVLSVLISIFAVSLVLAKAIPIFERFTNVSGMPIGMYFYLMFVYCILYIFSDREKWKLMLIPLFISVASVGFLYFQLLPGLLASFGVFFVYRTVLIVKNKNYRTLQKNILTALMVLLASLLVTPYVLSISVNAKGQVDILVPAFVWSNFKQFVLISLPMLVIISVSFRGIKEKFNRQPLCDFLFLGLGVLIAYLALRFPLENEYKYLSQFAVLLGIVGGGALSLHRRARSAFLAILTVLLLGYGLFIGSDYKLKKMYNQPHVSESGSKILAKGEEAEIYDWIMSNTTVDTAVIDTDIKTPCLAQRPLYAAKDSFIDGRMQFHPGYAIPMLEIFISISGYDEQIIDYRYGIIDKIYGRQSRITDKELDEFFLTHPDILIIFRNQAPDSGLRDKLSPVFESSNKSFTIYRPI